MSVTDYYYIVHLLCLLKFCT